MDPPMLVAMIAFKSVILLILLLPLSVVSNLGMTLRESVEGLEIVVGDVYAMEIEASGSCALLSSSPRYLS
ncbi:hypothetical protein YC2023_075012 [Brassica napus]